MILVSLPPQIRVSAMLLLLTKEMIQRWGDLQMYGVAKKVTSHIFFSFQNNDSNMRGSNNDIYCAHVCKYTVVRQIAPLRCSSL